MKLTTTILVVLSCVWTILARKLVARDLVLGSTNAERLRRGQPLIPPTLRKRNKGHKHPKPSSAPCPPLPCWTGRIAVTKSADESWIGYVSHSYNNDGALTITQDRSNAQIVELPHDTYSFNEPFDLSTSLWAPDPRHSFLGAAGADDKCYLGEGESGFAYLTGVSHTSAYTPPSNNAGHCMNDRGFPKSSHPSESGIWTIDCRSLVFEPHWINKDKSEPDTTILYSSGYRNGGFLGLTGDVDAWNSKNKGSGIAVTFTFVPECHPRSSY